jgi:hypothetical protein
MKVQSIKLKYFKKIRDRELDFTDPETGLARDLIISLSSFFDWAIPHLDINQHPDLIELKTKIEQL